MDIGLVLEGGGMRSAYTAGVLDFFMDENINFNYIIGVSAGASAGVSYISGQRGRNADVFINVPENKEAFGLKYFLQGKGLLHMDYIYHDIPNKIYPFDFDAFRKSNKRFIANMTDCETGEAVYMDKDRDMIDRDDEYINTVLQASSSLPIVTPAVDLDGKEYFDGGIVDSIPIKKSIEDGNKYNVLVLTRNSDYRKTKQILGPVRLYLKRKYPEILKKLDKRHIMYNDTVEFILEEEKAGRAFVFRPLAEIDVTRYDRDSKKLERLYKQGYDEALSRLDEFKNWIKNIDK